MPLDELVGAPSGGDPRVRAKPVTRDGMTMLSLSQQPGPLQAFEIVIPAAARRGEPDRQVHEGHEWLYVLSGRLRLVLGEHDLVLAAGEAAEFDTRTPHCFAPATTDAGEGPTGSERPPVELLALFSRQGERIHLRARSHRSTTQRP